ncbi:recombinase family protein [Draconibacterium sp. IB214405]|uniref:recombinase family protein n=1 Tax=Draconibacterium sp. IB214405 TaxID=3097352 RepID=UPI002A0C5269|nr:recombinase family protein [Draconibacterium sp. IB214405]MDX8341557.1 recombinase family protein [Draconibacterium sp. IB214405]
MSIGIYCRISKHKEEGRDVSISVQKEQGVEFAKSMKQDYKVFIDEGISGASDDLSKRPAFTKLLSGIQDEEINIVYCYDQSRIERNNTIWNLFVSIITEKGCKFYPGGRYLDLDIPENQFFSGMISLANALYAAKTGIKVKETIYKNAKKGKSHGLVAYGYKKGADGYFELHEDEAKIVERIFNLSLAGNGTYTIAKILNAEGIPTKFNQFKGKIKRVDKYTKKITTYEKKKVRWRGNVIHDIIKNPVYKGQRKWGNEYFAVPAIIDENLWVKVNKNLEKNKKKAGKRAEYHYLLNGIFFCGHCGSKVIGKKRLKGNDNAYKCQGKFQHKLQCESRGLSLPKIEAFIIRHLLRSHNLKSFLENVGEEDNGIDELTEKLHKTQNELKKNLLTEQKIYDRLIDPYFEDDPILKERLKEIKEQIRIQNETIDILENKVIARKSGSRNERLNNKIKDADLSAGFDKIKEIIHSIIKELTLEHHYDENHKGFYTLKIMYHGFEEYDLFQTDWKAFKWKGRTITKQNKGKNKNELKFDGRSGTVTIIDSEDMFYFD